MPNTSLLQPGQRGSEAGFGLTELLIVVALAGIFFALAVPGFVSVIESHHRTTISNRLMEDLAMARLQATAISSSMALCPSSTASAYACDSSTVWKNGWYVYAGSGTSISAPNAVLRAPQPLPAGWVVDAHLSNPATYLSVDARSAVTKFGHFTVYRSGYSTTAGCVTVSDNGRARFSTATVGSSVVSSANDPC